MFAPENFQIRHKIPLGFLSQRHKLKQKQQQKPPQRVSLWGGQASQALMAAPWMQNALSEAQRTASPLPPHLREPPRWPQMTPSTVYTSSCIFRSPSILPLCQPHLHHPVLTKPVTGPVFIIPPSFPAEAALPSWTPVSCLSDPSASGYWDEVTKTLH